jgi:sialate O-acetylesterase
MAVTVDIGNVGDIHPRNKQEVGRRLALWALGRTYGRKGCVSGPLPAGFEREDGRMVLRFEHADGGLQTADGGPLEGFCVAGEDRKFRWAKAEIRDGAVVVWHPEVKEPAAVRYAWADNPAANLVNGAGLPASPFRTDDWPGITAGKE